jgi:hypothetical protein
MNYEQWREHQRRSLGITEEQLDRILEVARAAAVATGGAVGYEELLTAISSVASLPASRLAEIALDKGEIMGKPKMRNVETGCGKALVILSGIIIAVCAVALALYLTRIFGLW